MNKNFKLIILIVLLVLLILGASLAYRYFSKTRDEVYLPETQEEIKKETATAPDFTVTDYSGNEVKLSDFLGKPVVVNFWASWCPPCKAELPDFDKVYEELGDDIVFMMVDLTDGEKETVETAFEYISDNGFNFPVYYDTLLEGAYNYSIYAIPTTLFISAEGELILSCKGQMSEKQLRTGLELIWDN